MDEETKEKIQQHISCLNNKFWILECRKNACKYASSEYYHWKEKQDRVGNEIGEAKELLTKPPPNRGVSF